MSYGLTITKQFHAALQELVQIQKKVISESVTLDKGTYEEMLQDCHSMMSLYPIYMNIVNGLLEQVRDWAQSMLNDSPDTAAQEAYDSEKSAEAYAINNKMRSPK